MKKLFGMPILAALFALLASATVLAAPPQAPRNLTGTIYQDGSRNAIIFSWDRGSVDDLITHYVLYRAPGLDATTGFEIVDQVGGADSADLPHVSHFHAAPTGAHTYRVTAVNADGESAPSNSLSLTLVGLETIRFTSTPPELGRVDVELIYDADAVASNGEAVRFELESMIDSAGPSLTATIDPVTGVLRATPRWPGYFVLRIRATIASDARVVADQYLRVRVVNCSEPTTGIRGRVVDDNGAAIASGYILYNLLDDHDNEIGGGSLHFTDGAYVLDTIDAGRYRLRVAHGEFVSEWFSDAYTADAATPLIVSCGQTTTADFTVTRHEPYDRYVVSGTVTAKSSRLSVPAIVRFTGFEKGLPPSHARTRVDRLWIYTNDSLGQGGQFSVSLPNTHTWIVSAEGADYRGRLEFDTLVKQYYDHASTPDAATSIDGPMTINFELGSRPLHTNGFVGSMRDADDQPVEGYVVAYPVAYFGQADDHAVTVEVGGGGEFSVTGIEPGEYILFAVPYSHRLAPGYFRENDVAALTWDAASIVTVGDAMLPGSHIIRLRPVTPGGIARLTGSVGSTPGRALRQGGGLQNLLPVTGALVAAIDASNMVRGTAVTDRAGQFAIDGLPDGVHRIVIDKAGFITSNASMDIRGDAANGTSVELERSSGTSAAPDETAATGMRLSAAPNPATDRLVVGFAADAAGSATLRVVDASGRTVRSLEIAVSAGVNRPAVDLAGLASGLYVVRVDGSGLRASTPVTIVR